MRTRDVLFLVPSWGGGRRFWKHVVSPGDSVIDATCGGGKDTLALARLVQPWKGGRGGRVLAIDVQEEALARTRSLLQQDLGPLLVSTASEWPAHDRP